MQTDSTHQVLVSQLPLIRLWCTLNFKLGVFNVSSSYDVTVNHSICTIILPWLWSEILLVYLPNSDQLDPTHTVRYARSVPTVRGEKTRPHAADRSPAQPNTWHTTTSWVAKASHTAIQGHAHNRNRTCVMGWRTLRTTVTETCSWRTFCLLYEPHLHLKRA